MDIQIGQTWADCDKRQVGRQVRIEAIEGAHAVCTIVAETDLPVVNRRSHWASRPDGWTSVGLQTRIRIDRFKRTSTGFELVS